MVRNGLALRGALWSRRSSLGWLRFSELWSDKAVMVRSGLFGYA